MVDHLRVLETWYQSQCDGYWEHKYGVQIETLDNPGWLLKVDLRSSNLAGRQFEAIERKASDSDWISCSVKDEVFVGAGGPYNLTEMIELFICFAGLSSPDLKILD